MSEKTWITALVEWWHEVYHGWEWSWASWCAHRRLPSLVWFPLACLIELLGAWTCAWSPGWRWPGLGRMARRSLRAGLFPLSRAGRHAYQELVGEVAA